MLTDYVGITYIFFENNFEFNEPWISYSWLKNVKAPCDLSIQKEFIGTPNPLWRLRPGHANVDYLFKT